MNQTYEILNLKKENKRLKELLENEEIRNSKNTITLHVFYTTVMLIGVFTFWRIISIVKS